MKRLIIYIFCFLLLASAVQAAEPFGGGVLAFELGFTF